MPHDLLCLLEKPAFKHLGVRAPGATVGGVYRGRSAAGHRSKRAPTVPSQRRYLAAAPLRDRSCSAPLLPPTSTLRPGAADATSGTGAALSRGPAG